MAVPELLRNTAGQSLPVALFDAAGDMLLNPIIEDGDFQLSIDYGAFASLASVPTVVPAVGGQVRVLFSQAETNGEILFLRWIDQAATEWRPNALWINTAALTFGDIAAAVWAYTTRTLTQTAASIIAAVTGSTITQTRAVDWSFSITGMGNIAARDTFYFTLKRRTILPDSEALVQIEETAGLVFINGKPAGVAGAANGTLTVTDAVAGDVTVTLTAEESAKLAAEAGLDYDFKMITVAGAVQQMTAGKFNISSVVTEAIT